jgi:histidinol dehydrogenase
MVGFKKLKKVYDHKFSSQDRDFDSQLNALVAWESSSNEEINRSVEKIIDAVKQNGDASVLDYTNQFDSLKAHSISELIISHKRLKESFDNLESEQKNALSIAAERIKSYHLNQVQESWTYKEEDGSVLGQKITPLRGQDYTFLEAKRPTLPQF